MDNNCLKCGNITTNPKFCSSTCSCSYNNVKFPKRKITKKCKLCVSPIWKSGRTFCKFHTEEYKTKMDNIQNRTIGSYQNMESVKNLHPSSKNAHIRALNRSRNKELTKKPCYNCGYDKHVELAHIKPISSFGPESLVSEVNDIRNLVQLCPNCHWEFDNNLLTLVFPEQ